MIRTNDHDGVDKQATPRISPHMLLCVGGLIGTKVLGWLKKEKMKEKESDLSLSLPPSLGLPPSASLPAPSLHLPSHVATHQAHRRGVALGCFQGEGVVKEASSR